MYINLSRSRKKHEFCLSIIWYDYQNSCIRYCIPHVFKNALLDNNTRSYELSYRGFLIGVNICKSTNSSRAGSQSRLMEGSLYLCQYSILITTLTHVCLVLTSRHFITAAIDNLKFTGRIFLSNSQSHLQESIFLYISSHSLATFIVPTTHVI